MAMECKKTGFTLVELLTVLAIITLLVGLLVPSMAVVRRFARETKQRAQLNSIDLALTAFRNDYGEYPPSNNIAGDYGGAQMLAEALLGWDLRGFHPDSHWQANGMNAWPYTDTAGIVHQAGDYFFYDPTSDYDMHIREGRYLELGTSTAFTLAGLFTAVPWPLAADRYVICDAFAVREVALPNGERVRAGTPILYYAANPASKKLDFDDPAGSIYNYMDNEALVGLGRMGDPMARRLNSVFYTADGGIVDPRVATPWPYRPDSYILISAGADGLYGTADDITNFGN
jgi:prepilin-type N-terminal cleavage/methylation domain-containing protein